MLWATRFQKMRGWVMSRLIGKRKRGVRQGGEPSVVGALGVVSAFLLAAPALAQTPSENPPAAQAPQLSPAVPSGSAPAASEPNTPQAETGTQERPGGALAPVEVKAGEQKRRAAVQSKPQPAPARQGSRVATPTPGPARKPARSASTPPSDGQGAGSGGLQGAGAIHGFVAGQSSTGTKTNTPILETPQSISVITPAQMTAQGATNLTEAIRYTSGVIGAVNATDTRWDAPLIRGFIAPLYLDGMLLPIGASMYARPRIEPFGLQEIDILKGAAASALYGQNPPGGLVNMISLRPPTTPVNRFEIIGNSFDNVQGGFDIGGPVDPEGHYLYRITGVAHDGGTQMNEVNDLHQYISPAFTWRPDWDTTLTFLGQYQHDRTGDPIQFLPAVGTLYGNPHGVIPLSADVGEPGHDFFEREQYMAGYLFEHNFDNALAVRQNLRYAVVDTNTQAVIGTGLQSNLVTLNRANYSLPENATAFTIDNQGEAKLVTGPVLHTGLVGIDFRRATSDFNFGYASAPSINVFAPIYGAPLATPVLLSSTGQRQDQVGLYAQDQMKLGGWGLTVSGRHDVVDTTTLDFLHGTTTLQDDTALSGRAGLNYLFDFGLAPYVATARSFQPNLGTTYAGVPFAPSFGTEYETGIKYQPTGTNLLMTAAAYTMDEQNVLTPDPAHVGFSTQTGQVRVQGVEFETKASVTDRLDVIGSYTYTDARITAGTPAYIGNRLPPVPLNQAAFWADYTLHEGTLSGFGFGGGARYIGNSYGDQANTLYIPSYTLFDAAAHYDLVNLDPALKGATLAVNALNLFNKYYVSSCQSLSQCYLGNGRVVKASLRYAW
jgi:iron complex outermembrane receptor protein